MNKETYQSWLTDRGIEDPPSGQPFDLIVSQIEPNAQVALVALVDSNDQSQLESLRKLAHAIEGICGGISWFAINDSKGDKFEEPTPFVLRNVMPKLSKIIYLTKNDDTHLNSDLPHLQNSVVASRALEIMRASTVKVMSENLELKRSFWNAAKEWVVK